MKDIFSRELHRMVKEIEQTGSGRMENRDVPQDIDDLIFADEDTCISER